MEVPEFEIAHVVELNGQIREHRKPFVRMIADVLLRQSVRFPAVEQSMADTDDPDVVLLALKRTALVRIAELIPENVIENSVRHAKMRVFEDHSH